MTKTQQVCVSVCVYEYVFVTDLKELIICNFIARLTDGLHYFWHGSFVIEQAG